MLVDSHCHLEMPEFDSDRESTMVRARDAGVEFLLTIGDGGNPTAFETSLRLASQPGVATTIGLHPHQANRWSEDIRHFLIDASRDERVVAWGEIGLDYHYDFSPRDAQITAFESQVRLGFEHDLPLIIHCRKAEEDTERILAASYRPGRLNGIMHCFTGNIAFAKKMAALGFLISFSGIVTFPRAGDIREAAAKLPDDVILVETDSPYLAPVPHRGKRNEPAFVMHTATAVAGLRHTEPEEVTKMTSINFFRLFPSLKNKNA